VVSGISGSARRRLAECWRRTGELGDVQFLPFGSLPLSFSASHLPTAAYVRLLLSSILPPHVDRCAYLDIDLLVGRDIGELLDTDLKGHPIGMVANSGMDEVACGYVRDQLGLDPDHYYNSGVLLIDAAAFRRDGHEEGLREQARRMPATWFADQDIINAYFRGRILPLDPAWNLRSRQTPIGNYILHFAGSVKPWQFPEGGKTDAGDVAWYESLRESGFVYSPSDTLRGAWGSLMHRFVAKSIRLHLRLKDRLSRSARAR
jgi:lipopolysaccharide biosynthesis glycosyltransferase